MSNMLRKMKKEVKQRNKDVLPNEMYNTLLGSFLVSLKIWGEMPLKDKELKKYYFDQKEKWLNNEANENTWIKDIVKDLNTKTDEKIKIPYGKIALVVSDYNMLVAPIIPDKKKEGEYIVLPLRPDGFTGITLNTGKVYPITFKKERDLDIDEIIKDDKIVEKE